MRSATLLLAVAGLAVPSAAFFAKKPSKPATPPPAPKKKFAFEFPKAAKATPAKAPAKAAAPKAKFEFPAFGKAAPAKAVPAKAAPKKAARAKAPAPVRAARAKAPAPVSKKSAPKTVPKKFTPKGIAAPGVSKQRPFAFGGRTPGPELYDDGLTEVERSYIERGSKQALTGAAKLRFTFAKQAGGGWNVPASEE